MLLWTILALMTGATALAALWPLFRRDVAASAGESRSPTNDQNLANQQDLAVYKDQLSELARDAESGQIGAAEAEAGRIEIARRILGVASAGRVAASGGSLHRARAASVAILVLVPAISLGFYSWLGSPSLPDQPLAARLEGPPEGSSVAELVMRVEAHLGAHPEDGKGWQVLAPIYLRTGRADDAKTAYAHAIRLLGATSERQAALGEAATVAAGGIVTGEAQAAFEQAVALDAKNAKARYFLGRAKEQDGDRAGALAAWRALAEGASDGSVVATFLRREIARVEGGDPPGGPSAKDVAAAADMPAADRQKMIRGMVEGLAARLEGGGGTAEEWLRLVRAWSVLGEKDKANSAALAARKALAGEPDELRALDDLTRSLGLSG